MANSLVIRKGTNLEKRSRALRAAQYLRMSTELQRYSIQNQAAAIAAYAQQQNLTIVRTYLDEGRSGLRIKGRAGLIELIRDVESGDADFDHVLVYDVSRWGRFQDVDESAHYEFVCKQKGVQIAYCAEQFDNNGSLLSSIVKNIKRVMAAEYSRELSVKVHAGLCRLASLGYRAGAPVTYGLRRELIDESHRSKGRLGKGEYKSLKTDRVRVQAGSDEEAEIVRLIFRRFAVEGKSDAAIARDLNRAHVGNQHGRPWSYLMVHTILKNENYIGKVVYNRTSNQLGQKLKRNPPDQWVRSAAAIKPIVDEEQFARAQRIMADRYITISEDEMLKRLRTTLARKGRLTTRIINSAPGLPCSDSYVDHFGSLRKAYALIGYSASRDCDWIDCHDLWTGVLEQHKAEAIEALRSDEGVCISSDETGAGLKINGLSLSFLVARQSAKPKPEYVDHWRVYTRPVPLGLLAVLRLDSDNRAIRDYVLLPLAKKCDGHYLRVSDMALARLHALRFERFDELINAVRKRLAASRAAAATTIRTNKRSKPGRPKTKNGRALR
ncbi:recombinase family protein [Bradyrhizobium sp. 44]|uniref:recombinase family protein n=1 Tax=Bradyrhizobium sp. 44 TaxID=2782675 RepID=UPI001FFC24D8|nr:recombinase family protein [Bradyrhizobium sp. 44]MCK1285429.1 recombinase family protein [Bradyrhizobium sp. 44]